MFWMILAFAFFGCCCFEMMLIKSLAAQNHNLVRFTIRIRSELMILVKINEDLERQLEELRK